MKHPNDAFISYNSADAEFAKELEHRLEQYVAPKPLGLKKRRLKVFRYEGDMTGTDYYTAIEKHLDESQCLILLCSRAARTSSYVDDEVRRFIENSDGQRPIIPVLIDGAPNNEAKSENQKAFPESLYLAATMPLAIDYRDYRARANKLHRRPFDSQWYSLLANLFKVSRDEIEQRDRARRRRRFLTTLLMTLLISGVLAALAWFAWIKRGETIDAQNKIEQRLVIQAAEKAEQDNQPVTALLLATKALKVAQTARVDKRSIRAEHLVLKTSAGLPGVGLTGWQTATPRQTSLTPWHAVDATGRWLITGHAGSEEARLWDLSHPQPGKTGALLPKFSKSAFRKGELHFLTDMDMPAKALSEYEWELNTRMFDGRSNPILQDMDGEVLSASAHWRLVKRENGTLWLEHRAQGGHNQYPSLKFDAPDIDWTLDTDMLFSLDQGNWLLMAGYRGHRLISISKLGSLYRSADPVDLTHWQPDSERLLVSAGAQLVEHHEGIWRKLGITTIGGFFRNLVSSDDNGWIVSQSAVGNTTVWQRQSNEYQAVYDTQTAWLRDQEFDDLGQMFLNVSRKPLPQINTLPGYNSPQAQYETAISITNEGVLSVRDEESIVELQLPELSILQDQKISSDDSTLETPEFLVNLSKVVGTSADGKWSVSSKGLFRVLNPKKLADDEIKTEFVGEWPPIGSGSYPTVALFSADSRWLLLQYGYRGYQECGYYATAKLIDLAHENPLVSSLNLEADRQMLAVSDGAEECFKAKFVRNGEWLSYGNLLVSLRQSPASVIEMAGQAVWMSPNSDRALIETSAGNSKLWSIQSLDPLDLINEACEIAGRNLSIEEWTSAFPGRDYEAVCPEYPLPAQLSIAEH